MLLSLFTTALQKRLSSRRLLQIVSSINTEVRSWRSNEEAIVHLHQSLKSILARTPPTRRKGAPDTLSVKKAWAQSVLQVAPGAADSFTESDLERAATVVSIDASDRDAYAAYVALYWLVKHELINELRAHLSSTRLVLHMTCIPRYDRAVASEQSFHRQDTTGTFSHIHLVGGASTPHFSVANRQLQVAAQDTYEQLPSKVLEAYELLSLVDPDLVVLKVDDDLHLLSSEFLAKRMDEMRDRRNPRMDGVVYSPELPSGHSRAWHFGKCASVELNASPIRFPSPTSWITGEYGYLLNHGALMLCAWANVYYKSWIRQITYEDVALGVISENLGIDRRNRSLVGKGLKAVTTY